MSDDGLIWLEPGHMMCSHTIEASPAVLEWARDGKTTLQPASLQADGMMRMNFLRSRPELRRRIDVVRGYRRSERSR